MSWSKAYWLFLFFILFLPYELYTAITGRGDTFSETFWWLRDSLPYWMGVLLSMSVGAVLVWLLSVHWLFSGLDRPGLDIFEKVALFVGLVLGAIGAVISRKRTR